MQVVRHPPVFRMDESLMRRRTPSRWVARRGRSVGFSLIELLVVVAIIALLVGILTPNLVRAKKLAQQTKTQVERRNRRLYGQMQAVECTAVEEVAHPTDNS